MREMLLLVSVMSLLSRGLTGTTCTNGKVYTTCGTMCPLTCDNKDNPPMVCPAACKVGCVCPQGMVENGDGCVLPENCPTPSYCQLPPVAGPCEAYIPSIFYNATSKKCESFIYGGCDGNENRFSTMDTCTSTCDDGKPSYCELPPMPGDGIITCLAYIPSYFYNSTSKKCESFIYGGCGGNKNRFSNVSSCIKTCGDQDALRDDDDSESYSWTYIGVTVALVVTILVLVVVFVGILVVLKERRNEKRRIRAQNVTSSLPAKDDDMMDQDFKGSPNPVSSSDTVNMI